MFHFRSLWVSCLPTGLDRRNGPTSRRPVRGPAGAPSAEGRRGRSRPRRGGCPSLSAACASRVGATSDRDRGGGEEAPAAGGRCPRAGGALGPGRTGPEGELPGAARRRVSLRAPA